MNWWRIKCAVFGHTIRVEDGHMQADVCAPANCTRCGRHYVGVDWSRFPPMPECKRHRAADWRERAEVVELLDAIERLSDRVDALEVGRSAVKDRFAA